MSGTRAYHLNFADVQRMISRKLADKLGLEVIQRDSWLRIRRSEPDFRVGPAFLVHSLSYLINLEDKRAVKKIFGRTFAVSKIHSVEGLESDLFDDFVNRVPCLGFDPAHALDNLRDFARSAHCLGVFRLRGEAFPEVGVTSEGVTSVKVTGTCPKCATEVGSAPFYAPVEELAGEAKVKVEEDDGDDFFTDEDVELLQRLFTVPEKEPVPRKPTTLLFNPATGKYELSGKAANGSKDGVVMQVGSNPSGIQQPRILPGNHSLVHAVKVSSGSIAARPIVVSNKPAVATVRVLPYHGVSSSPEVNTAQTPVAKVLYPSGFSRNLPGLIVRPQGVAYTTHFLSKVHDPADSPVIVKNGNTFVLKDRTPGLTVGDSGILTVTASCELVQRTPIIIPPHQPPPKKSVSRESPAKNPPRVSSQENLISLITPVCPPTPKEALPTSEEAKLASEIEDLDFGEGFGEDDFVHDDDPVNDEAEINEEHVSGPTSSKPEIKIIRLTKPVKSAKGDASTVDKVFEVSADDGTEIHVELVQTNQTPETPVLGKNKCPKCDLEVSGKRALSKHMRVAHMIDDSPETKSSCPSCHKSFSTRRALRAHHCQKSRSISAEGGVFKCKQCPSDFKKVHNLLKHIKEYHENQETEDAEAGNKPLDKHDERAYWETFFCKFCEKTFKRPSYFQKHLRTCKGKSDDRSEEVDEPAAKRARKKTELSSAADTEMACVICEKVFHDYYDLEDHEKEHEEDLGCEKKCRKCEKAFDSMTKLRAHVYDVHELKVKDNGTS